MSNETLPAEKLFDFYAAWELFWHRDVTWGELRGAANDD